jgi:creatinine amidohydrolase
MMEVDPAMIRPDLLDKTKPGGGVRGDPSRASIALGKRGVELVVTRTVAAIKKITAAD